MVCINSKLTNDVVGIEKLILQTGHVTQPVTTITVYFKPYNYVAGVDRSLRELKLSPKSALSNLSFNKVNIIDNKEDS